MKLKAPSVAFTLRNRLIRRGLEDELAASPRRQRTTTDVTPVRIIHPSSTREWPEVGPDDLEYQPTDPAEKPKDTLAFYVLGIAAVLYLLAMMFILLG